MLRPQIARFSIVVVLAGALAGCELGEEDDDGVVLDGAVPSSEEGEPGLIVAGAFSPGDEDTDVTRINNRRANNKLRLLNRRACLNNVARAWAQHMAEAGFISHNPSFASQITSQCGAHPWVGENVGSGGSELAIFQAFMGSRLHKANILKKRATAVGVGIFRRDDGTLFVVQNFADFTF